MSFEAAIEPTPLVSEIPGTAGPLATVAGRAMLGRAGSEWDVTSIEVVPAPTDERPGGRD